jgi:hypothetical protein
MSTLQWTQIVKDLEVPAKPDGLWTIACEFIQGPAKLKITAEGIWQYADEDYALCGPDGNSVSYLSSSHCINVNAPVGALVGKIGGGTADVKGEVDFVVGRFCVLSVPQDKSGTLFLSINDLPSSLSDNSSSLKVQVYLAQ